MVFPVYPLQPGVQIQIQTTLQTTNLTFSRQMGRPTQACRLVARWACCLVPCLVHRTGRERGENAFAGVRRRLRWAPPPLQAAAPAPPPLSGGAGLGWRRRGVEGVQVAQLKETIQGGVVWRLIQGWNPPSSRRKGVQIPQIKPPTRSAWAWTISRLTMTKRLKGGTVLFNRTVLGPKWRDGCPGVPNGGFVKKRHAQI